MKIWKDFVRGVHSPSLAVLFVGATLFMGVVAWGLQWFFNGRYCFVPKERWLLHSGDFDGDFRHELASFRNRKKKLPSVLLLGGSSLRDSLVSEHALTDELEQLAMTQRRCSYLGVERISLGDLLATVEQLPKGTTTLVIGSNFAKFNDPLKQHLKNWNRAVVPFYSTEFVRYVKQFSPTFTGTLRLEWILSFSQFYLRHHWRTYASGQVPNVELAWHPRSRKLARKELIARLVRGANNRRRLIEKYWEQNISLLLKIVRLGRVKGFRFVILDTPINPLLANRLPGVIGKYRKGLTEFSEIHKVPYLDFMWGQGFVESDFFDESHLVPSARLRFQRQLAIAINALDWPQRKRRVL